MLRGGEGKAYADCITGRSPAQNDVSVMRHRVVAP